MLHLSLTWFSSILSLEKEPKESLSISIKFWNVGRYLVSTWINDSFCFRFIKVSSCQNFKAMFLSKVSNNFSEPISMISQSNVLLKLFIFNFQVLFKKEWKDPSRADNTNLSCMPMLRLCRKFPPKAIQSWEVSTAWIHPETVKRICQGLFDI